jgi:hypothetical protein
MRKALQHKRIRLYLSGRSTLICGRNGTRATTRALVHLGECPRRLSVPKLTVRVRFPSPAAHTKERCNTSESVDSRPLPIRAVGPCAGHIGPHWATDIHTSTLIFSSEGRSACSITFSGCPFSGSSNRTQGVSPQERARCERAELQHREETRPVIQCTRRR